MIETTYGQLDISRWEEYKGMWLKALSESPESFAADFNEQAEVADLVWQNRLKEVIENKHSTMVFAFNGIEPIGMIGAYFERNPKFQHIATVWGAYVEPEYRNQGIATGLVSNLIKQIETNPIITKIKTYSVTNGDMAVSAYNRYGFEIVGISKDELLISDKYYDVYILEKYLKK